MTTCCVVIPAYNEEHVIAERLLAMCHAPRRIGADALELLVCVVRAMERSQ